MQPLEVWFWIYKRYSKKAMLFSWEFIMNKKKEIRMIKDVENIVLQMAQKIKL
jgi:hypothetical protein